KYGIFAEEGTKKPSLSPYTWIIDPLDGTTNFVHTYPFICISIALQHKDEIVLGVIYDPLRDELFHAEKGEGTYLNEEKITVTENRKLKNSLFAMGFPYELGEEFNNTLKLFKAFVINGQGVRRDGSAALDLCYVAAGRVDGFWEYSLAPWDMAAGSLIVLEAGGKVTDMSGGKFSIYNPQIVASNSLIHEEMLELIKKTLSL
ncbi:MAG: inositol monophosphatase family protein, partial [Fidelibacterota bacterium]